jgi:hypothetical protein
VLPPHAYQIAVIPVVDSIAATDDHPPPEPCVVDGDLQLTPLLSHPDLRANPNARIHMHQDQVTHMHRLSEYQNTV